MSRLKNGFPKNRDGLFGFAKGWIICRAKPNSDKSGQVVPLSGWHKIVFKKCGWEKNKKHRVGNECLPVRQTGRLTRCPLEIWSVCWSPVKMVCPFVNVQFLVVCLFVALSSFRLTANGFGLCVRADFGAQNCQYSTNVDAR